MNRKEVEQIGIFKSLARKEITQKAASECLGLSERRSEARISVLRKRE